MQTAQEKKKLETKQPIRARTCTTLSILWLSGLDAGPWFGCPATDFAGKMWLGLRRSAAAGEELGSPESRSSPPARSLARRSFHLAQGFLATTCIRSRLARLDSGMMRLTRMCNTKFMCIVLQYLSAGNLLGTMSYACYCMYVDITLHSKLPCIPQLVKLSCTVLCTVASMTPLPRHWCIPTRSSPQHSACISPD